MARADTAKRLKRSSLDGGRALTEAEVLALIPAARARSVLERKQGLRALTVRFSDARKQLVLELTNGPVIGVPVALVPALRSASSRHLAAVELTPTGSVLHWAGLDVDQSVPSLPREALGGSAVQSLFGVSGGLSRSRRKAEAARANGAKGGRPRRLSSASTAR